MAELLKEYEPETASISLIPSDSGRFEVTVNGKLVYSKLATGRHASPGEISRLVKEMMTKGKA